MLHQNHKTLIFTSLMALVTAPSLSASFESLVNDLGLSKDSKISTTQYQLSPIFDVREEPKIQPKKVEKVEVKRTPFETQILKLHKAVMDLGFETHPLDRELWGSFLMNLATMSDLPDSVHPAFRKNQIAKIGQSLSQLGESYERDVIEYFSREKPQMLGKAIGTIDKIEARYMALYAVHEFMTHHWAQEQTELVAPLMISAIRLSQAKLIEGVFEEEYQAQLNQEREERRKIKMEQVQDTEIPQEITEDPTLPLEEQVPIEPSAPEITRDEIKIKYGEILKKLKGRFLPVEVRSWDPQSNLTFKEVQGLVLLYQAPFDEIANLVFSKPEKKETEETDTLVVREKEVFLPYEIPGSLKSFKHPGIFSMINAKLGVEKAEEYLFLRCLGLLEEMEIEKSDKERLMEKLKGKWRLHITQGKDSNPENVREDKSFEAFLKAYSEWALQNKELSKVRGELETSNPLKGKYDHFMRQQGEKFKLLEEGPAQQILNRMVGLQAWVYHQALQKKSEPKGNVKPMEETLRKIWVESVL